MVSQHKVSFEVKRLPYSPLKAFDKIYFYLAYEKRCLTIKLFVITSQFLVRIGTTASKCFMTVLKGLQASTITSHAIFGIMVLHKSLNAEPGMKSIT